MAERVNLQIETIRKNLIDFMVKAYRGMLIRLPGRPEHFEEADRKHNEGPFAKPPSSFKPNVKKDFKNKNKGGQ